MNNLKIQPKKCFLANTNDRDVIIPPLLGCCYRFRLSFSSKSLFGSSHLSKHLLGRFKEMALIWFSVIKKYFTFHFSIFFRIIIIIELFLKLAKTGCTLFLHIDLVAFYTSSFA